MLVTCNIMSYKYGHLAAHAIESVLGQNRKFDVIRFYDDGVGDCEHLVSLYPEVEFILRPNNLGIIDNFNHALLRTETDKVMFLGADNWLEERTLVELLDEDADIISFHGIKHMDTGAVYWEVDQAHGSSLYDVQLAKKVGGYEHSGNEHSEEDSMLFNKMIKAGATLEVISEPLLNYRWDHRNNYNEH